MTRPPDPRRVDQLEDDEPGDDPDAAGDRAERDATRRETTVG